MQAKNLDEMERLGTRLIDHIRMDQDRQEVQVETAKIAAVQTRTN
jgi:hypothetical protein